MIANFDTFTAPAPIYYTDNVSIWKATGPSVQVRLKTQGEWESCQLTAGELAQSNLIPTTAEFGEIQTKAIL